MANDSLNLDIAYALVVQPVQHSDDVAVVVVPVPV